MVGKGEFEFICDLRRINMNLPATKKIKVILADYQLPYSKLTKSEEWKEQEDRNAHMAHIISKTILSSDDHRGNLFLVGCGHAYKSEQKGIGSSAHNKTAFESAGAQLAKILGDKNVFCVSNMFFPVITMAITNLCFEEVFLTKPSN